MSQTVDGVSAPTDGLHLIRLLFRPHRIDLAARYARLLRTVGPSDEAPHPLTRHAGEILYQAGRRDRWTEAWAYRDAMASVRDLLGASDLSTAERAYGLTYLASASLAVPEPEASGVEMEAWSSEALALASGPRPLLVRGAVLLERGEIEEGGSRLRQALRELEARGELFSIDGVLVHAFLGRARVVEADLWRRRGEDEGALKLDDVASRWFALARKLARKSPRAVLRVIDRLERAAPSGEAPAMPSTTRLRLWLSGEWR